MAETAKPQGDDLRNDDLEYNPQAHPKKSAKAWLNLLRESEKAFERWNDHCDKIDKLYASLDRLASMGRDKEFAMFWANCEVIKPSIYARAPVPVVTPKFKDRRPVPQAASEFLERCCTVAFDITRINDTMMLIRDDVAITGRGVPWCRYESGKKKGYYATEKVCIEFKQRGDFLHSVSRNWYEVTWVAGAAYLTRSEARKRFRKTSGDEYKDAEYKVDKDAKEVGGADARERAKFWEIWDKANDRVVWVAQGCENILDEDDPHLELSNFFPCPMPAYGVIQRGSLVPVPDVMQYKDQLEELNTLTGRIHALSDALEVKGFYPAGGAELGDAVQTAIKMKSQGRILVPISNWAAFGGSKEVIIWLPIDMIATTITALVALRKQVIDDIYQITGMADIMRGDTDPTETLGAQQLKTQYGSIRVRDKQRELQRLARDLVEITSEIITQKFDAVTMIEMSQTQLPTKAMAEQQIKQVMIQQEGHNQQIQRAIQMPQLQQAAQQNPQMLQQGMQAVQQMQQTTADTIKRLREKPTVEQVLQFLKSNRTKSFVLDIETDSTIQADEDREKQRRTEFVQVLGNILPQLSAMVTQEPKTAAFAGELLKFATAPFRAGRSLDGAIDELVEQMKQIAEAGGSEKKKDPLTVKAETDMQIAQMTDKRQRDKDKMDNQVDIAKLKQTDMHKRLELNNQLSLESLRQRNKGQDGAIKMQVQNEKLIENRESHQMHMAEGQQDMQLERFKAMNQFRQGQQQHQQRMQQSQQSAQDRQQMQQAKIANAPFAQPRGRR